MALLQAFCIALMHITPNSWKIIWALTWFYEWKECRADRWEVPDRRDEKMPEPIFALTKEMEAHQRLVPIYLQCQNSAYPYTLVALVSSPSGVEKKKKRPRKEEVVPRMIMTLSPKIVHVAAFGVFLSEVLVEPDHSRMMGSALAGP
ncbi:hypothetical protein ACLOJK_003956 [Asimina triloba]